MRKKAKKDYEIIEIELTDEEAKEILDLPAGYHSHIKINRQKELLVNKIKRRKTQ
jgi:hypothetical protein